jgi:UDP-2,4-diacetamido-2,4,6-trideoxy-beta-L-altropyranose hydrolase
MKIAFRTDASLEIGSGHVMRCLTLADALRAQGAQCCFISRAHPGNLIDAIALRGYEVKTLPATVQQAQAAINFDKQLNDGQNVALAHAAWLGCNWKTDAAQSAKALAELQPDWLVVDHYAIDQQWETALTPRYKKLMVIDDLADRSHQCDLLLDQNLGRQPQDYRELVPVECQVLTGPQYALLRPEFAALRQYSLQRRQTSRLKNILITMGGVDQPNATGQTLQALQTCALLPDCRITVVMGMAAPWLKNVQELATRMPWPTEVLVNISNMAQRMADSDLAIGAAGSTSWERCCLGVPTLMVVLAENQQEIAFALESVGAAIALDRSIAQQFTYMLANSINHLVKEDAALTSICRAASMVTNGHGTNLVAAQMLVNRAL